MKVEQMYTGCLAEAAYYIESNGEVAIVDPLRDPQPYIDKANAAGAKIKYIFETHFHADFVSGHVDLAKLTGATIVYGPTTMKTGFDSYIGKDNEVFDLGKSTIQLIHTPGHTMESSCYLLKDENGKEQGLISGDTLFIGDVGRPDLAQHVIADLTEEKLARHLYNSLRNKVMPLSDDLIVYPNHGAGSACGKNMSKETTDTLGNQKRTNYALQPMSEDEFVKAILTGLTPPPGYFPKNVLMNIQGYESIDEVKKRGENPLNVIEFETLATETNALIVDTRNPEIFAKGFIPNSLNIGLSGNFAQMVGELIADIKQEIILVAEEGKEEEAIVRLSRIGYDNTVGYLKGGFEAWQKAQKPIETITRITAEYLENMFSNELPIVIDVRKKSEFDSEHLLNAINIPLHLINNHLAEIPKEKQFVIHCAGGYRSMIAASILKQKGWNNFLEVEGGFKAISQTNIPKSEYVCPTTLL